MIKKPSVQKGYSVPSGAEIWWYGLAANLPGDWEIDISGNGMFVKIAGAGQASNTITGAPTHTHAITIAEAGAHTHVVDYGFGGPSWGNTTIYASSMSVAATGHTHSHANATSGSSGLHDHTLTAQQANNLAPNIKLYLIRATQESEIPVGAVIMFDGLLENRPDNFEICNGTLYDGIYTPDLRNKFVAGATQDGDVGQPSGTQIHDHVINESGEDGAHLHTVPGGSTGGPSKTTNGYTINPDTYVASSSHTHSFPEGNSSETVNHTHAVSTNTDEQSILPAWYKLYYIMRTK